MALEYYFYEAPFTWPARVFGPVTEKEMLELYSIARNQLIFHDHSEGEGCLAQLVRRGKT